LSGIVTVDERVVVDEHAVLLVAAGVTRAAPLTDMHPSPILVHMRTTLILDDELIARARGLTGLEGKTALVHEGLRALIARESARRLAALGGSERSLRPAARRRPARPRRPR
jgi:Arc/MetJ family transcription regulator